MSKNTAFLGLILILGLSSCATVFSGTTQAIHVQAVDIANNEPLNDVNCVLTDAKNITYPVVGNPGVVNVVKNGAGVITPYCKKVTYQQTNFGAGNSFDAITIVNMLFWPNFIVDNVSGPTHKYPSHITVFMTQK